MFHSRRARSPWGGRSILITSAPSQASIWVHDGPGLVVGEVDDANALERLAHVASSFGVSVLPTKVSSFRGAVHRLVDPRDDFGRQRPRLGRG